MILDRPIRRTLLTSVLVSMVAPLTGACGDKDARPAAAAGGTLVVAWRNPPDGLVPPLAGRIEARQLVDLIFDRLAMIAPRGSAVGDSNFVPRLARRWEWSTDSLSVRFDLDPRARWHDGHAVRSDDIVFSYGLYRDSVVSSPSAADLKNVDSVTVRDSLTVVAWFHRRTPMQFGDLVMNLVPVPAHLWRTADRAKLIMDSLARSPVGSGQFRLAQWDANQQIVLVADSTHPLGRPLLDRIVFRIAADDQTNLARLLTGEVDVMEVRTDEQLSRVGSDSMLRVEFIPGFAYGVIQFNLRAPGGDAPHPILAGRELRRALAMATNRPVIVASTFGNLARVALGPFVRAQFSADTTVPQMPFDPAAARRTLDSLGWRTGGAGIRARGGHPLKLTVLVPTGSPAVQLATLLQSQWRDVGVDLRVEPVDGNAMNSRAMGQRNFDIIIPRFVTTQGFTSLPQSWGSPGAAPGGRNFGRYENPVFDAHVDSALASLSLGTIRAQLRAAYTTIVGDAPGIFLFETRGALALHRRLVTPTLSGDGWWFHLASWSIAPGQRLPRDVAGPIR